MFEGKEQQAAAILKEIIRNVWNPGAWELALAGVEIGRARILDQSKLLFFPVRKCGSTSVLNIFKIIEDKPTRGEHIHQEDASNKPVDLASLAQDFEGYFSFALVRDPIARLVSYHRGNILARNQLAVHHENAAAYYGLPTRPEWDFFVQHIDRYRQVFVPARNHTDPVSGFLGHEPSVFSWLGGLSDMPALVKLLSEKTTIELPVLSDMASPDVVAELPDIPEELMSLYADDYRLYGQYF